MLHRLVRHAVPLEFPYAMLDCVLRTAMVDLAGPQEGFAVSLYVKALGHDERSAEENWASRRWTPSLLYYAARTLPSLRRSGLGNPGVLLR